jgi:hypothetical protein
LNVKKQKNKNMRTLIYTISILLLTTCFTISMKAQALFDLETGLVFTGYNNVRIAGNQGTLFSLKEDLTSKADFFYRIRLNYTIKSRHTISLLYAPLEVKSEGSVANAILFEGVTFPAYTELTSTYKFNSYRLTYRYTIINKPKFEFGLGFTAKIRDAKITLASSSIASEKTNIGFVPIVNFRLMWQIDSKFGMLLEGDALAAPQGRAEDVLIAVTYKISDLLVARGGYRILEGGADNDEVYNFALFNYAAVGLSYTFKNKQ